MKTYLEPEEVSLMEKEANNIRDRLLILILFRPGLRVSEALGITVEDIDLANGTITIHHLKARTKLSCPNCYARLSKSSVYCPGCGVKVEQVVSEAKEHHRMRTVPLDKETLSLLADYINRGGPVSRNGKVLLFGINRHRAWQIVRECADKAGLPPLLNPESGKIHGVSPHRLRDAFAVHAVKVNDTGDGLRLLQKQMGHASFNTTAKYRKVAGEELKRWHESLWSGNG